MISIANQSDHEWVTRHALAKTVRLSVQRIDQLRTQFGHKFEKKPGNGPKILICQPDWLRLWAKVESRGAGPNESEQEFFGDDGDWQDKCWEEKFYALQDERAKRHKQIIPREDVHQFMTISAAELRQLGEVLQKRFGPDAQDDVDDCLDNIVHHSEAYLNGHSGA